MKKLVLPLLVSAVTLTTTQAQGFEFKADQ